MSHLFENNTNSPERILQAFSDVNNYYFNALNDFEGQFYPMNDGLRYQIYTMKSCIFNLDLELKRRMFPTLNPYAEPFTPPNPINYDDQVYASERSERQSLLADATNILDKTNNVNTDDDHEADNTLDSIEVILNLSEHKPMTQEVQTIEETQYHVPKFEKKDNRDWADSMSGLQDPNLIMPIEKFDENVSVNDSTCKAQSVAASSNQKDKEIFEPQIEKNIIVTIYKNMKMSKLEPDAVGNYKKYDHAKFFHHVTDFNYGLYTYLYKKNTPGEQKFILSNENLVYKFDKNNNLVNVTADGENVTWQKKKFKSKAESSIYYIDLDKTMFKNIDKTLNVKKNPLPKNMEALVEKRFCVECSSENTLREYNIGDGIYYACEDGNFYEFDLEYNLVLALSNNKVMRWTETW